MRIAFSGIKIFGLNERIVIKQKTYKSLHFQSFILLSWPKSSEYSKNAFFFIKTGEKP